jgi:type II secretory pathway predicted ATPase ExeA
MFRSIQERIINLSKDKKITPVIMIDESQHLKTEILNDFKILFNFEMDSKNHAIVILTGQPTLNHIISKQVHDCLKQRIVINYNFIGISKQETIDYISSRLVLSGVHNPIFNSGAIEAIYSCSNASIRKLNSIVEKCLLIGFQQKIDVIDTEIVMSAQNEIELI